MVVELEGGQYGVAQGRSFSETLVTPMDDPRLAGLTKRGSPSARLGFVEVVERPRARRADDPPGRHREAVVVQDGLGDALVHADGRREDAGPDVGHRERFEMSPESPRPRRMGRAGPGTRRRPRGSPSSRCADLRGLPAVEQVVGRVQGVSRCDVDQRGASVDPSSVVGESDDAHGPTGVERGVDDPPCRDARDLVFGRRASVDDRHGAGIRHRPRLYNRRER